MQFGITKRDGAAQKAPHGNTRTPHSLNVASRKRHKDGSVVCKGYADVLKRDATRRVEKVSKYPPELMHAARIHGVSCDVMLGLIAAQRNFG